MLNSKDGFDIQLNSTEAKRLGESILSTMAESRWRNDKHRRAASTTGDQLSACEIGIYGARP